MTQNAPKKRQTRQKKKSSPTINHHLTTKMTRTGYRAREHRFLRGTFALGTADGNVLHAPADLLLQRLHRPDDVGGQLRGLRKDVSVRVHVHIRKLRCSWRASDVALDWDRRLFSGVRLSAGYLFRHRPRRDGICRSWRHRPKVFFARWLKPKMDRGRDEHNVRR